MSRARAGLLLWGAACLLVPLPYYVVADGSVPVVRFAMMAAVAAFYSAFVDGSGVAWILTSMLAAHAVLFALVLAVVAALIARLLPPGARTKTVASLIVAGFVVAVVFDVYRTPFDDAWVRTSWPGLFQ